jgi:hypothetical protein
MCSSNDSGTPTGTEVLVGDEAEALAAICSRRSISRTSCAYSSMRRRSAGSSPALNRDRLASTESRMLRSSCRRAARSSAVPPSPYMRSNTSCGFSSIGSGVEGVDHEMLFVYAQL